MKTSRHLEISEIVAFREGSNSDSEHRASSRHLLRCAKCRSHLPTPRPEDFLNSLVGEDFQTAVPEVSGIIPKQSFLSGTGFSISNLRPVVFAALLLLAVTGMSILLLLGRFSSVDDKAIALDSQRQVTFADSAPIAKESRPDTVSSEPTKTSQDSKRISPPKDSNQSHDRPLQRVNRIRSEKSVLNVASIVRLAETRGAGLPCGGNISLDLEVKALGPAIRLRWDKIQGAVSYRVYISDLDERLIDEYETTSETSYTVRKTLNPELVYRWKLIVVLKNGRMISGQSQNFKVIDLSAGESRDEKLSMRKKSTATVRCVENK